MRIRTLLYIVPILLLIGCGSNENKDTTPYGSLRISVNINGLGDTNYVVQRFTCGGYPTYQIDDRTMSLYYWANYDLDRYKTLQEARVRMEQIRRMYAREENKQIATILQ
jgi:penicillin V acylase-like amidase (Ntn superfamily)